MAIISLFGVGFAAGETQILEGIDLALDQGEFLALLGPSGCGKSSLLRLIAGFERASAGEIHLDGRTVSAPGLHVPPERREIGMVFQSYALWPHLDVAGNVGYSLRVRRVPRVERAQRVAEALDTVGLAGFQHRRIQNLSGGQRQRVALARCLAMKPRLLLLDEPLANLDAHLREAMVEELRRVHRLTGVTVIYVTHDQAEARALADRIAVMEAGRVVQIAPPQRLWQEPASASVARFLGRGQIVPVDVLSSGPVARVRLFGTEAVMRASADLRPGSAMASLRRSDIRLAAKGFAASLTDCRALGDTYLLTVVPNAAPELVLRLESQIVPPVDRALRIEVCDGWILPNGNILS
ncbi:MAG: ABC transporter ATP-binding protein [Paracoccus sp. (in: a-proteobacteria)]|nr:ABC transporter ATP-binding protein [Paracoccus sp. (in: a-proteobacteria)]